MALTGKMAHREKRALMASLHPSVIMAIGISGRLTRENLRSAKRVTQVKKEKRATLEQPVCKAQRVTRATRLPILISPLSSLPRLKAKKAIPERRGLKETLVT